MSAATSQRAAVTALALTILLLALPARADSWLSVELDGAAELRARAIDELAQGTAHTDAAPARLVGYYVGAAPDLAAALLWVDRALFPGADGPSLADPALNQRPAPPPGSRIHDEFGLHLLAAAINDPGADGGAVPLRWPSAPPLPARWRPAALIASRAPVFAAPAPVLPPAEERHALILRRHDLWVLGAVDRCVGVAEERRCLRWAQVIARDGDRFIGGYIPAAQLTLQDAWQRAASGLPRAQLVPAALRGEQAIFVLHARTRDSELHHKSISLPAAADGFPALRWTIEGDEAVLLADGAEPTRIRLDRSMDARAR
jgi:hypothetical protein